MPRLLLTLFLISLLTGCASVSLTKVSHDYKTKAHTIKHIAVMPINFKVFMISSGGVTELMDEWSNQAIRNIKDSLQMHFAQQSIELNFITEKDIVSSKELWLAQKGLFEAVSMSIYNFAYQGPFKDRIEHFDYTMGKEFAEFASSFKDVDAVLFVEGADSERTTGRVAMEIFQAGVLGVQHIYTSSVRIALVDSKSGDVLWFKVNGGADMDFRNSNQVDHLIQWFSKDFLKDI